MVVWRNNSLLQFLKLRECVCVASESRIRRKCVPVDPAVGVCCCGYSIGTVQSREK